MYGCISNQKYCTCDREKMSAGLNINGKYNITNIKAFLETEATDAL